MMNANRQVKYSYLATAVGVGLMAIAELFGAVRAMMFRPSFRTGVTGAPRQFVGGGGFGLTNGLTILAVIIAIVGVVWLGLELRRSKT